MLVLLAALAFRAFPAKQVTVINDGRAVRVNATFDTRDEALDAAAVELRPGDRVLHATGGDHASVAVQRARTVAVQADGAVVEVRTQATTVAGALAEAGIELASGDRVYLAGHLTTEQGPLSGASYASATTSRSMVNGRAQAAGDPEGDTVELRIVRARPVTVFVDTLPVETSSAAATVQGLLAELGMTVREGDLVEPALDAPVTAGMTVRLAKARTVNVTLDGEEHSFYTQAETVADVVRLLDVDLGPDDQVSVPLDTRVTNGMDVTIALTRHVVEEVEKPIPPPTVYIQDSTLPPGTVRIEDGSPGSRIERYRVTYENGSEVDRELVESIVVEEAVPTRHITGPTTATDAGDEPPIDAPGFNGTYKKKMRVLATWYNATHGGKTRDNPYYGITATGVPLDKGICAVDPSVIPLGTWMYIPGYGKCLAADVGGAVKGNHVDLGFPESAGSNPWGTQYLEIYILD